MVAPTEQGSRATRYRVPAALLLCLAVGLAAFGLVVLTSAGKSFPNKAGDPLFIFKRQAFWFVPSLFAGLTCAYVNLDWIRRHVWKFYGLTCFLLVLVVTPGIRRSVKGASRWLEFGPVKLQVSDIGKVALIIALAHYLTEYRRYFCPPRPRVLEWRRPFVTFLRFRTTKSFPWLVPLNDASGDFLHGFAGPCAVIAVICGLIVLEPDLGTTVLCAAVGGILLFTAGVRHLYVWPLVCSVLATLVVVVINWPSRLRRVASFLDPEGTKMDAGYQLWQGMLGFAVGGRDGAGLGQGMQQESFLPEAHTDFVFAIAGEELGLVATVGVVVAFLAFFWVVVLNLRRMNDVFRFNVCLGATLFIVLQALINMGVVTGLLPTKGMSLPFISYGGTNLVMMFALVGLILNCMRTGSGLALGDEREIQ
jgi:cell division protein FtsW